VFSDVDAGCFRRVVEDRMPRLALATGALAALSSSASAQSIALDEFRPAIDARGYMTVNGSQTLGHGEMSFGLGSLEWGHRLLSNDGRESSPGDNMVSATLVGALGLRLGPVPLQLGVALPFTIMDGAQQMSGQGVGDLALHLKTRLARAGRFGVSAIASVYVPTGSTRDPYLGEAATTPQLMGVADATFGRVRVAVNAGIRIRRETTFMDMTMGSAVPVGVGFAYALSPERVELLGEVFGSIPVGAQRGYQSLEALAGIKVYLARNSYMTLGAGRGLMTEQAGNPDFRGVIGIVFEPRPAPRAAGHVPDERVAYVPPAQKTDDGLGDRDNDGIFDRDDKCPDVMEDYDGVDDDDGCPEDEDTPRDLVIEKEAELVTLRPIEFEFDKAILRASAYPILDAVAKALSDNPEIRVVEVQGHTDEQGPDAYNLALSNRRAATVRRYLIDSGIAPMRLTSKGYGETDPVDPSHTQAAYTINRRVAFIIRQR
jgi:outer membrane protein OmpA-like peptidoglycan-associated protein